MVEYSVLSVYDKRILLKKTTEIVMFEFLDIKIKIYLSLLITKFLV